jgi:hypothetical protein
VDETWKMKPQGRYCRRLAGADFSLEANTPAAPAAGPFFILRCGDVLLESEDFGAAEEFYKDLCRQHWEAQLTSANPTVRIASAWGLLGIDADHPGAIRAISTEGNDADRKRLEQVRRRRRMLERPGTHRVGWR